MVWIYQHILFLERRLLHTRHNRGLEMVFPAQFWCKWYFLPFGMFLWAGSFQFKIKVDCSLKKEIIFTQNSYPSAFRTKSIVKATSFKRWSRKWLRGPHCSHRAVIKVLYSVQVQKLHSSRPIYDACLPLSYHYYKAHLLAKFSTSAIPMETWGSFFNFGSGIRFGESSEQVMFVIISSRTGG